MSIEGTNNFQEEYSPAIGAVLSKRVGERLAVYVEPMWVGNANRPLIHPEPGAIATEEDSFIVGLGTRIRVRNTLHVSAEYVPRVSGFSNGDDDVSFGLEKRVGGHLFQVNLSNGLGGSLSQVAGGCRPGRLVPRLQHRPKVLLSHWAGPAARASSVASSRSENRPTDSMCTRSSGECGNSITGPKEIMSIPGIFFPMMPHSRPA